MTAATNEGMMNAILKFDHETLGKSMAVASLQYMQMVMEIVVHGICICCPSNHLLNFYFVHDRLNYALMIPLYLADLKVLGVLRSTDTPRIP